LPAMKATMAKVDPKKQKLQKCCTRGCRRVLISPRASEGDDDADERSDAAANMSEQLHGMQTEIDSAAQSGLFQSLLQDEDPVIQRFLRDVASDPTSMLRWYQDDRFVQKLEQRVQLSDMQQLDPNEDGIE